MTSEHHLKPIETVMYQCRCSHFEVRHYVRPPLTIRSYCHCRSDHKALLTKVTK